MRATSLPAILNVLLASSIARLEAFSGGGLLPARSGIINQGRVKSSIFQDHAKISLYLWSFQGETFIVDPSLLLGGYESLVSAFDLADHPFLTVIGSYILVTASDMVPFVPCQPLAISLGAKLGFAVAFPITTAGQTTAGILAFLAARKAADAEPIQNAMKQLDDDALSKFQDLKRLTSEETQDERTILLALIGLRLAPFFPFSAGNYLLGGATAVPLRLFVVATLLGCALSNFLSTSLGAGGSMLLQQTG